MELMLNKLRSTVSNAASNAVSNAVSIASQVSNYLPGNPVTREYEATSHIASAGRGLMWKIYKGFKKSTKEEAAIFLFEKRQLDKWDRQEREVMLDRMRKGISQLTRLRHPQVLTVQHPLEESRETLAFATEPVFCSLSNVLGNHENMPSPLPHNFKDFQFYDVEIKYGLMQIAEGLAFLHNSVKVVHRCICPENIVLNQQGAWKLFGFDFCIASQSPPDQPPMWSFEEYESSHHEFSQPDLDYLAPEYALSHTLDPGADIFSVGVVIHAIYNKGKPVFENHRDFSIFKRNATQLKTPNRLSLDGIPAALKDQVRLMLNSTPQLRPDALQFSKISYFDDIGVKTLSYLDQLFQWDNMQKSQFYKSLPQILPQLPQRVLLLRVIPCLNKECVNPTMVPFVLPVILHVAENASKEEYVQHILPHLKPIMKINEPMQVMLLLMLKMELLLSKTPAEDIRSDTLPLLYRALECNTQQIQELCLSVLPTCAPLVDSPTMKNAILPRIKKLCLSTGYLSVRVNCLVCIGKVMEHLDKWLVTDEVFPFLAQVPSKEAPVVMAMVGIFKMALYHNKLGISKEVLATKVLPFLFPLSIENSLTPSQHTSLMTLVKDMVERVETEHKTKLEHLESIRSEQKSLEMAMPSPISPPASTATSSFSEGNLFGTKDKATVSNDPSMVSSSANGTVGGGLSLEDKQRIANQQTVQKSFSKQTPILPSPPVSSNPIQSSPQVTSKPVLLPSPPAAPNPLRMSTPKGNQQDSTSSLIASNLSSLNLTPNLGGFPPDKSTGSMNAPLTNYTTGYQPPMGSLQTVNWGQPSNPAMTFNQFQAQNPMSPPQPMGMSHSMNFSSQFGVAQQSKSMGSMWQSSPMTPVSNSTLNGVPKSSGFKPLSSSDINDFLS